MSIDRRWIIAAAAIGVLGLAVTVVFGLNNAENFFRAYLFGYTFWLGLGLGSLGIVLIQFLTGGNWGLATRRVFEAGTATLPLVAVLFIPILFGLPYLYAWARPDAVASDAVLQHKAIYLNVPFFILRSVVYLVAWVVLGYLARRWSLAQDRSDDPLIQRRLQRFSVIAALILGFTVTFAAIDWLMSLDADWFSTMYPPMVAMGDLLLALALGTAFVALFGSGASLARMLTPEVFNDLGSLLLAFIMLWGYLEYFQYLLIWAGNLSDEIPWYLSRTEGGWLAVAVGVGAIGFLLPWYLLLFRPLKRDRRTLAPIAGLIALMQLVNVFWMVQPPFEPGGPVVDWLDVLAVVGFGGVWLAVFCWQLTTRPLLPVNDPRVRRPLEAVREPA
ncbi:MAG: hypothetical protein JO352_26410 [Chloroflexi bacterium]|nr:hypothetical protein [Chloroflexota bacterium]